MAYGSPIHYDLLAHAPGTERLQSFRLAISTAMALRDDVAIDFQKRFGTPLNQAYGIIEVGLPCINTDTRADKLGSVGPVTPPFELVLEDVGLGRDKCAIKVRGPGMLDAYYDPWTPQASILKDGWFQTGDLGWMDDDGFVFITGRSKEVISVGGAKFFPQEVEAVLESHASVQDACVMRQADQRMGDRVVAQVVLVEDAAPVLENDLKSYCRERLAAFKVPEKIEFTEDLGRTASGKLKRTASSSAVSCGW